MATPGKSLLMSVTALVWAAALAMALAGRYRLAARAPTEIALTTWPPAVLITIDGEKQFEGAYALTPLKLALPPGRHRLTIGRDGYFAQSSEIEDTTGRTIEMSNVVLQRNPELNFATVEIESADGDLPVTVDVNDGFGGGDTPVTLEDVQAEVAHILTIRTPAAAPGEKPTAKFRCRFTPPFADGGVPPHKIRIKAVGNSYKATGCVKLKLRAK